MSDTTSKTQLEEHATRLVAALRALGADVWPQQWSTVTRIGSQELGLSAIDTDMVVGLLEDTGRATMTRWGLSLTTETGQRPVGTASRARHDELRKRLIFFGFTLTSRSEWFEHWALPGTTVVLEIDESAADYDSGNAAVEAAIAPFERAYRLGRRDEATDAAKRVWGLSEQFDTDEAVALPDGQARTCLDLLEDAAFAAGGEHFFGLPGVDEGNTWRTPWSAAEPGLCGCARCVNERAAAERADGVSLWFALGSIGRMIVCETCGSKRCPHATFHGHACAFSNEPDQPSSGVDGR